MRIEKHGAFTFRMDGPPAHLCNTTRKEVAECWDWDTESYVPIYEYVCSVCGRPRTPPTPNPREDHD